MHRPRGQSAVSGEVQTGGCGQRRPPGGGSDAGRPQRQTLRGPRSVKALEGGNPFSVLRPARWSGLSGRATDAGAQARRGTWAGPAGRAVHAWTTLLTCACLNPPGGGSEEEQHRWVPRCPRLCRTCPAVFHGACAAFVCFWKRKHDGEQRPGPFCAWALPCLPVAWCAWRLGHGAPTGSRLNLSG